MRSFYKQKTGEIIVKVYLGFLLEKLRRNEPEKSV